MKRGLCFFAAEYHTKSPVVIETFKKHLVKEDGDQDEKLKEILKEFCDESPVLKQ